jgi:glycosyltransferase involved in cell wall biosynthesis
VLRIGIVVPHVFMHRDILPGVIFSPATLALDLVEGLIRLGQEVTLFSPGPVNTHARSITADLSYFQQELNGRGDTYLDLLKKHPFTFVTLARQVQSELIAEAFAMANRDELDIVHIYTNEEDTALPFASLCKKPVVFTHHDPFNFLVKYKNVFPKYKNLNWISISEAQRAGMPPDTNWAGTVYHGIDKSLLELNARPGGDYIAYLGRIIQPKGLHAAIAAVKKYNQTAAEKLRLKIAGKHYAGHKKDTYWQEKIAPLIDGYEMEYVGFIGDTARKQEFLGNAQALIVPSLFEEPFGMVMIEALACGTPIVGLNSGAIGEVIEADKTGVLVQKIAHDDGSLDEDATTTALCRAIPKTLSLDRQACRAEFEARFTSGRMCRDYLAIYMRLAR